MKDSDSIVEVNYTVSCKRIDDFSGNDVNGNEPQHDKINKMTCAPSGDVDQHPPSLIRVFAVRSVFG